MNDVLLEAITGEPVTVTLGGQPYPLAYPIQGVIVYKRETALLDRERSKDRPRLTYEEKRELRTRRQKMMADADLLRPGKGADWLPEKFLEFDLLMDEATALKIVLDEDAGTGDSLYDMYNWRKISPDGDPERLVLALWVGLHQFVETGEMCKRPLESIPKREYRPQFSREKLGGLIDLGNGGDLTLAISKALSAHLIAHSEEAVSSQPSALSEGRSQEFTPSNEGRGDFDPPNPRPPSPAGWKQPRVTENPQPPPGIPERRRSLQNNPQNPQK